MLGQFNDCNIITLSHKATTKEDFEEINTFVLHGISGNIFACVQYDTYGAINKIYIMAMGYYVIKFVSEAYTLQDDNSRDGQIISSGELVFKAKYLRCIQYRQIGIGSRNIRNKSSLFQHKLLYIHVIKTDGGIKADANFYCRCR